LGQKIDIRHPCFRQTVLVDERLGILIDDIWPKHRISALNRPPATRPFSIPTIVSSFAQQPLAVGLNS